MYFAQPAKENRYINGCYALYGIPHINIVLTAGQICEHAREMEYTQPVDRATHELRKQIEPNPAQPRYIKTVYRVGYRFTAYRFE